VGQNPGTLAAFPGSPSHFPEPESRKCQLLQVCLEQRNAGQRGRGCEVSITFPRQQKIFNENHPLAPFPVSYASKDTYQIISLFCKLINSGTFLYKALEATFKQEICLL
jgi:hypothetical protein